MSGNVQVLIECEDCGNPLGQMVARCGESVRIPVEYERCPNCAKLTYGPLTEEMVADALIECSHSHNEVEDDYYECEARFVLRLLNDGGLANDKPTLNHGCIAEDWRNWLLDLARQK